MVDRAGPVSQTAPCPLGGVGRGTRGGGRLQPTRTGRGMLAAESPRPALRPPSGTARARGATTCPSAAVPGWPAERLARPRSPARPGPARRGGLFNGWRGLFKRLGGLFNRRPVGWGLFNPRPAPREGFVWTGAHTGTGQRLVRRDAPPRPARARAGGLAATHRTAREECDPLEATRVRSITVMGGVDGGAARCADARRSRAGLIRRGDA
jgi:hypothetical protein